MEAPTKIAVIGMSKKCAMCEEVCHELFLVFKLFYRLCLHSICRNKIQTVKSVIEAPFPENVCY